MQKSMLCLMLGVAVGCAEPGSLDPGSVTTDSGVESVALVKFTCPTMH